MAEVNRGTPGTKPTLVSKSEILASVSLKNTDSITQRMSAEGKALFKQIINTPNPLQAEVLRGSIHN